MISYKFLLLICLKSFQSKVFFFLFYLNEFAISEEFSVRKDFNKVLNGFYKSEIYKCNYIDKSWSIGFEAHPYGLVKNDGAFKSILVFEHKNLIELCGQILVKFLLRGVSENITSEKKCN